MKKSVFALALLAGATAANAQLLVGHDDTVGPNAWEVDVTSGMSTVLWGGGIEVWGMAYGNGTVYANDGSLLRSGPLGAGAPMNEVQITFDGAARTMTGLAFSGGFVYGTPNTANEAVYRIDPDTGVAEIALDYEDGDYDFGGLAYNPADGLFYGTNDDSTPARGLYSLDVFGSGAISLVAEYPAGETDIDGLAVGNGIAYLVEDEAGDTIHRYDLGAGMYLSSLTSPMTSSEVFSGAAFVPAPGALALLGLGGLAAARRRR